MCVLSIKVPIRKKSGNLFNDPRIKGIYHANIRKYVVYNKNVNLRIILYLNFNFAFTD